jgi:hypothetical protein
MSGRLPIIDRARYRNGGRTTVRRNGKWGPGDGKLDIAEIGGRKHVITDIKPGARFRSSVCDVEVIVIKAGSSEVDLRCGGHQMLPAGADRPDGQTPEPGFDGGTQLGKRYTDEKGTLEVLCTKAGSCSLSVGDTVLQVKDAKPLPSSD